MTIGRLAPATEADGFTLIELLVTLVLIGVMTGMALFYLSGHQELYKPDDQTRMVSDLLQEARQRSLTQRVTMRVEIDLSQNLARLVNENVPGTADDDVLLRTVELFNPSVVRVGTRPANIINNPPETLPVPNAVFALGVHPMSANHSVATLRFQSNGSVVNAGTNATGTGAIASGTTLHIWSPSEESPVHSDIARAITVVGSSGAVRIWEYDPQLEGENKWKDSRRSGTYGATGP